MAAAKCHPPPLYVLHTYTYVRHSFMTHTDDACPLLVLHCDLCASQTEKSCLSSWPYALPLFQSMCVGLLANQTSAWSNNTTETPTFIISRYSFRYAIPEHYQYLYALRSILSIIIDCYIIKEDTWPNKNNFPEIFQVSFALCPICIGKVPSLNRCNYGLLCVTQQWLSYSYTHSLDTHTHKHFVTYSPNRQAQCDCVHLMGVIIQRAGKIAQGYMMKII